MLPDITPGHDDIVHSGDPVLGLHQALQALGQTFLEGEKVDTDPGNIQYYCQELCL